MSEIKEQWETELENALEALHYEQSYSGNWHPEWIKEVFIKTLDQQRQQAKQEVLEELIKVLPKDYYIQDISSLRKVSFDEPRSEILKIINKLNIG